MDEVRRGSGSMIWTGTSDADMPVFQYKYPHLGRCIELSCRMSFVRRTVRSSICEHPYPYSLAMLITLHPKVLGMCEGAITAGFLIVTSMFWTHAEQSVRVGYWCEHPLN